MFYLSPARGFVAGPADASMLRRSMGPTGAPALRRLASTRSPGGFTNRSDLPLLLMCEG